MKQLEIRNLRRITSLEFRLPGRPGAYLLTGANGAGKSTLLSCLAQLGDPEALGRFFQPNLLFRDDAAGSEIFAASSIRFVCDTLGVEFHYRDGVWSPDSPETMNAVFRAFGFSRTVFTGAKPKRLSVPGESFSRTDLRLAPESVRKAVSEIFDDEKFLNLYLVQSPVTHEDIFLLKDKVDGREYYFSENNFSAGERAVLKLCALLAVLEPGALVLIDEAEMALHPKAQKRLLGYLDDAAAVKCLTILVSTQSASLIKIADPRRLLFLEREPDGSFVCRDDVYPAAILGEMAFSEEILPETILLVEDQEAALLLEAIVAKLKSSMTVDFPYCKILPVGGYMQVVILLDNLARVFPPFVKRRAVLDKDAESNIRRTGSDPTRSHSDVVSRNLHRIYFLPCAPEQGVIQLLENDPNLHSRGLGPVFGGQPVNLFDVMRGDSRYRSIPSDSRSDCKDKLTMIAAYLRALTGEPELFVRQKLYRYYIDVKYRNIKKLKTEYCPLIFRR